MGASPNRHQGPMSDLHMEYWGGGAHGPIGRPPWSIDQASPPTNLSFCWGIAMCPPIPFARVSASSMSVYNSGGTFDPCDDTCHILIHWNFVPWIMPHLLAVLLEKNHLHTFSNQHLWNLLIYHPMLTFIPFGAHILRDIWRSKWVKINRQQDPPHLVLCSFSSEG